MLEQSASHYSDKPEGDTILCEDKSSQHSVPALHNRQHADEGGDYGDEQQSLEDDYTDNEKEYTDDENDEQLPTPEMPFPGFEHTVFKCLPQTHRLRLICLHLITSPWFERLVIFVILLNCLTLGMYQPCEDAKGCTTTRCKVLEIFDHIIYAFFVIEMVIKLIAMGFIGSKGYLAETWNRLDMFIIIAGAAEYSMVNGEINLSAIRTIRVLRPLRAINRIPNLRILVMLLLDTLPMLGNVLLICFFVFFIFGILGVQLWAGMLRQRCYMTHNMTNLIQNVSDSFNVSVPANSYYEGDWTTLEFICSLPEDGGMLKCGDIKPLVTNNINCTLPFTPDVLSPDYVPDINGSCVNYNQYYTDCRPDGPNPFQKSISFDNIASAWIAIFQVISLEGWVDIMYYIQDVHTYWVWVYFLALIVIGSFFMVNLFLVVIATQFSETKRRETEKIAEERKRYKSSTTLTSSKTDGDGCYNQMLKYIIHVVRRAYRRFMRSYRAWAQRRRVDNGESDNDSIYNSSQNAGIKLNVFGNHIHCQPCYHVTSMMVTFNPPIASPEASEIDAQSILSRGVCNSPHFYKRSGTGAPHHHEPVIVISSEQDETSFNSINQNGGHKVKVSANDGSENSALLQVVSPRIEPGLKNRSNNSSRNASLQASPQHSPLLPCRQNNNEPRLHSPLRHRDTAPELHQPLFWCASEGERTVGNHLVVPKSTSAGSPSPNLSANRLRVPGDMGSSYSIQSHSSSASTHKSGGLSSNGSYLKQPLATDGRFSFSQLSYMQGGCDLCCPQCQHLCKEYQRQERLIKSQEETKPLKVRHRVADKMSRFRRKMKVIVNGTAFRNSILIAILINTVMMGIEHYNQPPLLTQVVEYSNYVFIGIFTIEMLFKLLAEGFLMYIKDAFNVFDGFVVIMSFVELGMGGENSGLSVLRTFRLLRILKLIRFLPALQRQFLVMVRTLDNVASFFGLLMLFMFIFSVLGMNLFGCLFCGEVDGKKDCNRNNFDSLLWSLITVFQILTQEDWNLILYDGMEKTSPWAALYFVALMTFGNYVLFNLLVAILVEGFSSVGQKRLDNFLRKRGQRMSKDRGDVPPIPDDLMDDDDSEGKLDEPETRGVLPSIITDHSDKKLPPIITRTDATPRGSPKSNAATITPRLQRRERHDSDNQSASLSMSVAFVHSPSLSCRRSHSGSPRLYRKNSSGSRTSRRQKSEDKMSLVEAAVINDEDETFTTSRQTFSNGADNRSRNGSLRNFDLLQVPGRKALNSTSSDNVGSVVSFDMDDCSTTSDKQESLSGRDNPLLPLSLQIPEQQITPPDVNANCNGKTNNTHPPLVRMNGGLGHHGEHTPLLLTPKDGQNGCKLSPSINALFKRSLSGSSLDQEGSEFNTEKKLESKQIHGSFYSRLNAADEMEKQYPYSDQEKLGGEAEIGTETSQAQIFYRKLVRLCKPRGFLVSRADYALYVFAPTNPIRRFCKWLSSRKWFDYFILMLIALNCITLAVERPSIPPDSKERYVLTVSNYCFTALFLLEMIIKITARGFIIGKDTYLHDGWNVNDGFLVFVSVIDVCITFTLATSPKIFGVLRVLRLLRALRPLRVISRAPGLKLVVETLLSSLRPIGNIVLICLTFFLIFGILGVQLFRGSFFYCDTEDLKNITYKADCIERGYKWENHKYNFDDLGNALMSLFVLSSKDGWVMIMYQGLDAVGEDMQPQRNHNEWMLLYFISFLLLVGFFVLNMFVGVVVENFHRCREAHEKEEREKREQRKIKKLTKKLQKGGVVQSLVQSPDVNLASHLDAELKSTTSLNVFNDDDNADELNQEPYYTRYSKSRRVVYNIVTNKLFDIAVSIVIFLNVISMAVEHYQMSEEMQFSLKIMNYVFTFIFMLEAMFKILAYGFVRYIKERWNQLDTLIIVLSLLGIALEEVKNEVIPINPTIMRVMRILRIARVLKLLKVAKGIRALLDTVLVALPQVGNLGLLFFLLFFIFAALGVELFGRIECSSQHPCEGMGVHANFENSGSAFLTLFRIATGDNWNGIMKDALREDCSQEPDCEHNCCVNKVITPIYFVVFVLTAQFVLVNVVVAVLMKHLEDAHFSIEDILCERRMALESLSPEEKQILLAAQQHNLISQAIDLNFNGPEEDATIFNNYIPNRPPKVEDLESDADDESDFNDSRPDDAEFMEPKNDKLSEDNQTGSNIKQYKSHSLLPQHKPLLKHFSLPSNFKIHPSTLDQANAET